MRRFKYSLRSAVALAAIAVSCFTVFPVMAQGVNTTPQPAATPSLSQLDEAVFFFAGRFHSDFFGASWNPFTAPYENNYVLGGGYQKTFWDFGNDFRMGGEAGLALRVGDSTSWEGWGGVFARYDGLVLGNTLRISPSITAGISVVSGTIGVETQKVKDLGRPDTVLYYLGPELNLSLVDHPNWEVFWRIQHRSGGWGTLANIDASNAEVVGIRYKF